jgi:hypothetical protein
MARCAESAIDTEAVHRQQQGVIATVFEYVDR